MKFLCALLLSMLVVSCNDPDQNQVIPPSNEPENKTIELVKSSLVYYGDMDNIEISNLHKLTLYTDMTINEQGYPIGPGQMIRLSINSKPSAAGDKDISLPEGKYQAAVSSQDFNPFTFNFGYSVSMDLPEGKVDIPEGSFYGNIASKETDFPADLLADGSFSVTKNSDGSYLVEGVVVGDSCLKRKFSYRGKLDVIDRSGGDVVVENTTLKTDLTLTSITKARLFDRGDWYYLGDESYRTFQLYLASSQLDLSDQWATGTGEFIQVEFFVPFAADVKKGIADGEYKMTTRISNNGLPRENIIPGNIAPGYPDKFSEPEGSWYFKYENSKAKEYARVDGGKMVVRNVGGNCEITIEFTDCAKPTPNKIKLNYTNVGPIPVYEFIP